MEIVVVLAALVALGTVGYGFKLLKAKKQGSLRKSLLTSVGLFGVMVVAFFVCGANDIVLAAPVAAAAAEASGISVGKGFQYLAAAFSTGLATIGTGMAVGSVGSSAIGAVSEDPTILGKTLIFVGMAEGIAIYGMIISILILFN